MSSPLAEAASDGWSVLVEPPPLEKKNIIEEVENMYFNVKCKRNKSVTTVFL